MLLNKHHIYQVYRGTTFLGILPGVVSPFQLRTDINTGFSQLGIELSLNPDTASDAVEALQTEDGQDITTETGEVITIDRQPDVVGDVYENTMIRNNNRIKVYEYSDYYPNGKIVFSGRIESWEAEYGAPNTGVTVECLSDGADLENQIIQTGVTYTSQIEQLLYTDNGFGSPITYAYAVDYSYNPPGHRLAQVFVPGSSFSLGKVAFYQYALSPPRNSYLKLYQGNTPGSGTLLATASVVHSSGSFSWVEYVFPTTISLTSGVSYYLELSGDAGLWDTQYVGASFSGDVYGGGNVWTASTGSPYSEQVGSDLMFKIYSADATVVSPYTSTDPTTMLESIIDDYRARGGSVNYDGSSTELTGLSVSYEFKTATTLEGIKKALELSPYDWYWYVDVGTSIIYFRQTSTTGDHTLVKGRHLSNIKIKATIEQVVNKIYFSGGDTGGGVNLFKEYSDPDSIAEFGQRLERISDNRVTLSATAGTISNSRLDESADESYQTTIEVIDGTYDTTLFKPGETIRFEGFGTFVDGLVMRIASVSRDSEKAVLSLGVLPPRLGLTVEQALKDLLDIQTVDNPDAPS